MDKIDKTFNTSEYNVYAYNYNSDLEGAKSVNEKNKEFEKELFKEITQNLESDMKESGLRVSYAAKIIIRDVALNILILNRFKKEIVCRDLVKEKEVLKTTSSRKYESYNPSKKTETTHHHDKVRSGEIEINSVVNKEVPRLQKQIKEGLRELGLLPLQQVEQQTLTIKKSLKKDGQEISVQASKKSQSIQKKKKPLIKN